MSLSWTKTAAGLCLAVTAHSSAAAQNFGVYLQNYPTAQLYQANEQALETRLALLDQTPPGGKVKIATFVFDYGKAVKRLASHMCRAVREGKQVELVVDAKSGELVDAEDASDATNEIKAAEELYQLMANCGVKVHIHNANVDFVTVSLLGKKMPNFFGLPSGSSVSPTTLLSKIRAIKAKLVQEITPTLNRLGVRSSPAALLDNVQGLVLEISALQGAGGLNSGGVGSPQQRVFNFYRAIVDDPIWSELNEERMQAVSAALKEALLKDKELRQVFTTMRRMNRLNHRKIFLAQGPDGSGCAIIGGRNLGDHYLINSKDNFRDGDVMVCSPKGGNEFLAQVDESFEELKSELTDEMLGEEDDNVVLTLKPNLAYQYKYMDPREIAPPAAKLDVPKGIELAKFTSPVLLKSSWDKKGTTDRVRMNLLEGIVREQKEIYIETAYAEFNGAVRRALEDALARGVRVRIVTNSLFISDGPSKIIRLWMAAWNDSMSKKYPRLFSVDYASKEAGHMIHIKTAAFRCQKGVTPSSMYMIGSHNFHPRSGYSDKENSLMWREDSCKNSQGDLIDQRIAYWTIVSNGSKVPVLHRNMGLWRELFNASYDKDGNGALARALEGAMFEGSQRNLYKAERMGHILRVIDNGGLKDLIGIVL